MLIFQRLIWGGVERLEILGDVTFSGLTNNSIVGIRSLGTLSIANGATIGIDSENSVLFEMSGFTVDPLTDTTILNERGSVFLGSDGGSLELRTSTISATGSLPEAFSPFQQDGRNFLEIESEENLCFAESTILSSGSMFISSEGEMRSEQTSFQAETTFVGQFFEGYTIEETTTIEAEDLFLLGGSGSVVDSELTGSSSLAFETSDQIDSQSTPNIGLMIEDSVLNAGTFSLFSSSTFKMETSNITAEGPALFSVDSDLTISESSITADSLSMNIQRNADLDDASITTAGAVNLENRAGITVSEGSSIEASDVLLSASEGSITIDDSNLAADEFIGIRGFEIVTLDTADIESSYLEIDGATVDIARSRFDSDELNIFADADLSLAQLDLRGLSEISMAARTLILSDIQFASTSSIQLGSENGQLAPDPNSGASAQTGYVNFIQNVTLDNQPAQDFVSTVDGGNAKPDQAVIDIFQSTNE